MKFQHLLLLIFCVLLFSCSPEPAPNYENRLKSIGKQALKLSETYNSSVSYQDTIFDFAYGGNDLYSRLNYHHFRSDSAHLEVGKRAVKDFNEQEGAMMADYFIKFIQGKKEVWLRLRYNQKDDKFHMEGYHTEKY